ncbi:hypothetical protein SADUNF_Sadunf02G0049900 [Salix dunnii]|uniref:Uncharacterized protein n=1 Tax=Salix dunnii TaxID=1413687 RepID=A0A835TFI1_9ROSI|nr:hypothetical protein SADUNF_Sadunf02G0049900 [Salix dunnii]
MEEIMADLKELDWQDYCATCIQEIMEKPYLHVVAGRSRKISARVAAIDAVSSSTALASFSRNISYSGHNDIPAAHKWQVSFPSARKRAPNIFFAGGSDGPVN